MTDRKIDYDRGVIIRTAADIGMDIFMYRGAPGVYLNAHGHQVGEEIAKMAGFDVDRYRLQKKRKEAMAAAASAVDAELLASETTDVRTVVEEKDGYKIILLSAGRHVVEDPDGNVLTQGVVLTLDMARRVLQNIAAGPTEAPAPKPKPAVEAPSAAGVRAGGRLGATPLRTA